MYFPRVLASSEVLINTKEALNYRKQRLTVIIVLLLYLCYVSCTYLAAAATVQPA